MIISTVAEGNVSTLTGWTKRLPQQVVAGVVLLATCGTLACQRDGVEVRRHYLDREIRDLSNGRSRVLGLRSSSVDDFQHHSRDVAFYDGMAVHLRIDGKSLIGRVTSDDLGSVDVFASPDNIPIDLQQITGVLSATFGKKRITDVNQITTFINGVPMIILNEDILLEKGTTVSVDSSEAQVLDSRLTRLDQPLVLENVTRLDGIEYLYFSDGYRVVRVMVVIDHQQGDYHLQDNEIMFVIAPSSAITTPH